MRIITFKRLKEYTSKDVNAATALYDWYYRAKRASWGNLLDVKKDFNSVDYVGNERYIFNIKGNHYRLICIIIFASKKVYIRFIGTHAEYNKINAKTI